MIVEESEFKGRPMLVLKNDENDRFPFSFGMSKAKKMLEAYEQIKAFVAKHDKGDTGAPTE